VIHIRKVSTTTIANARAAVEPDRGSRTEAALSWMPAMKSVIPRQVAKPEIASSIIDASPIAKLRPRI